MPHKYLMKEFEESARTATSAEPLMQHICQRIHAHIPRYNWIGFYLVDPQAIATLVLGPHMGSFTPNAKIALHEGLCGRAAATGRVLVSDNVEEDPRCLRPSDIVKSQISVPIMPVAKTVAVFHVESYFMAAFKPAQERDFVEGCSRILTKFLERTLARDLVNA
jgi:L-methionine (R)-S-oxide reductase